MKKILCLILALTLCLGCVIGLASCSEEEERDIYDLAAELNPTRTTTFIEYTTSAGEKLNGEYVLEVSGEDSIFTYTYDRYRTAEEAVAENNDNPIKTVEGAVYCKDGKYSSDGVVWGSSPVATEIKFNLDKSKLTDVSISADGKTLTATLTKEQSIAILGTDLAAVDYVDLTVTSNGTYLTGVVVACTTESGAEVTVRTSYSYNKLTLEFPEA